MPYVVGVDLGKKKDPTAVAFVEHTQMPVAGARCKERGLRLETHHWIRRVDRLPLGTPYPEIIEKIALQMADRRLANASLVVDETGVGAPVLDWMRLVGLVPIGVTLTGGGHIKQAGTGNGWMVPKKVLVSNGQLVTEGRRIHYASGLRLRELLIRELDTFTIKITANAHEKYEAGREGEHDDVVLATLMAVWWGERICPSGYGEPEPKSDAEALMRQREQKWRQEQARPWWQHHARPTWWKLRGN